MTSKILPLNEPKISTYTTYGTLFSIMDEKMLPWVYNNFIQIRYAQGWGMFAFDQHHMLYKSCPGLLFYTLPQDVLSLKWKHFKDVIIDAINEGYYISVFLDRYYLPVTHSYLQKHKNHEILIYGYDLDNDKVYVADNFQNGKFIMGHCSFEDVEKAFPDKEKSHYFETEIRLLKVRDSYYECNINPEQIRMGLEEYLYSKRTFDMNHEQTFDYGLDAINQMLNQIENTMSSELPLDLRGFHLFYEHKILMEDRLNYLMKNDIVPQDKWLSDEIATLKQGYLTLRNLVIKFNIKKSTDLQKKISDKLKENVAKEKGFVAKLIEHLKKYEETMSPVYFYG